MRRVVVYDNQLVELQRQYSGTRSTWHTIVALTLQPGSEWESPYRRVHRIVDLWLTSGLLCDEDLGHAHSVEQALQDGGGELGGDGAHRPEPAPRGPDPVSDLPVAG